MKIIIVGVGKVGSTLCDFLAKENHDIVIVDTNRDLVEKLIDEYDVSGVVGSGASNDILVEAGAKKTDIIIATTEYDELNILACLFGKRNGIKYAVARIRNPEYAKQTKFFYEELNLDMIINPELEAALEIERILHFPSAENIETFADNKVEIVGLKLNQNSVFINLTLEEARNILKTKFLVCAVERNNNAIIPNGKFKMEINDTIYVIGSKNDILKLFKELGIYKNRAKNIMIIGGGFATYYLASQLLEMKCKVKIIEMDKFKALELKESLPNADIILGDGSNRDLLIEEGIDEVDAFVSLTGIDEENIILSLFAKHKQIPKVITKINKISYNDILTSLELSSIISPKLITTFKILRYIRSLNNALGLKVETLYKIINNQVEALEFLITEKSEFTNIPLKDLRLKPNILISAIIRGTNIIVPSGEDMILPHDRIIIVTTNMQLGNLNILG